MAKKFGFGKKATLEVTKLSGLFPQKQPDCFAKFLKAHQETSCSFFVTGFELSKKKQFDKKKATTLKLRFISLFFLSTVSPDPPEHPV